MIKMALPTVDKLTITNIVAALIILGYVGFMILYPDKTIPDGLVTLAGIAIGWFFTTGTIVAYAKAVKTQ